MADEQVQTATICDVINYAQDIQPFPIIKIYSGVGSGKSFFATTMIKGSEKYGIPKHNVLIITSRRIKVEETLKEMGVLITEKITKNGNLNFDVLTGAIPPDESEQYAKAIKYTYDWGESTYITYNKSVICTNAYISAYLKYIHNPNDPVTHIWNKFDAIIIDEVHSLITNATYQPAAYAVLSLIKEYLNLYQNNKFPFRTTLVHRLPSLSVRGVSL
ncbi:MAG: DEAD/DEAH box helicase family protein [Clostridia bacterium]|nr:DEAD/DEAH box helicase family protein [Clostridia bacterium]